MTLGVVLDTGPLIRLAQVKLLEKLNEVYSEISIPPTVFREAVTIGLELGFEDAPIIKQAIDEGLIKVRSPSEERVARVQAASNTFGVDLGLGETEAIALGSSNVLLTDDESAMLVAKSIEVKTGGTPSLLIYMVSEDLISKEEAVEAMEVMIEKGFWLSPRIVHRFHKLIEEV